MILNIPLHCTIKSLSGSPATITMTMRSVVALLLSVCSARQVSGGDARVDAGFKIIERRELPATESPSIAPFLPSFDGDLNAILKLALAKAARTDSSGSNVASPSFSAPSRSPTAVAGSVTDAHATGNSLPAASKENPNTQQLNSNLGLSSILLVSFGSAAVTLLVGSVYVWKRSESGSDSTNDGTTTNGWNSTLMDQSNSVSKTPQGQNTPSSQFVLGAYGFSPDPSPYSTAPSNMPAIVEDDDEISSVNSSAIMMSEAGFSTDNADDSLLSIDIGKSNYTKYPESPLSLLGARARNPNVASAMQAEDESESDRSSDLENSYRSTTPIPESGALDSLDGLLDGSSTGRNWIGLDESVDDDLLLFTR
jgi:hypothetical protein